MPEAWHSGLSCPPVSSGQGTDSPIPVSELHRQLGMAKRTLGFFFLLVGFNAPAATSPSVEVELVGLSPQQRRTGESCTLLFRLVNRSEHRLIVPTRGGIPGNGVDFSPLIERVVLWPDEVEQAGRLYPSSGRAFMEWAYGGAHIVSDLTLDPGTSATFSYYLVDIPKGAGILLPFRYEWEERIGRREPLHLVLFDRRDLDRKKLPIACFDD